MAKQVMVSAIVLLGMMGAAASEPTPATETWIPTSRNAQAVTGKVTLAPGQMTFQNGKTLALSRGGQMLFRGEKKKKKVMADLYRVTPPDDPALENGNKLCGGKPAAYLIVWQSEKVGKEVDPRTMVVYSGPKFDPGSRDECARFVYDAGK